jgi:hypothetical protein
LPRAQQALNRHQLLLPARTIILYFLNSLLKPLMFLKVLLNLPEVLYPIFDLHSQAQANAEYNTNVDGR